MNSEVGAIPVSSRLIPHAVQGTSGAESCSGLALYDEPGSPIDEDD